MYFSGRVRGGRNDKDWADYIAYEEKCRIEKEIENETVMRLLNDVHPRLMLKIVYDVNCSTHSGYCSDPDNIETVHKTKTEVFKLPTVFKKSDICRNRVMQPEIDTNNRTLQRLFAKSHTNCDKGSGHCGCRSTYSIKSATIFAPILKSELEKQISFEDVI